MTDVTSPTQASDNAYKIVSYYFLDAFNQLDSEGHFPWFRLLAIGKLNVNNKRVDLRLAAPMLAVMVSFVTEQTFSANAAQSGITPGKFVLQKNTLY